MTPWKNAATHQVVPTHATMNALVILGTLGSGKTTTIVNLLGQMSSEQLSRLHLVVNEVGSFAVDIDRVNQASGNVLDVAGITAGCLGCANLAQFIEIVEQLAGQRGLLLIEPTGVADGHEIRAAVARFAMPWHCLTLVNPSTFQDDMRVGILPSQLEVATMIGITRPEVLSEADRDHIMHSLAPYGVSVIDVAARHAPTIETLLARGETTNQHHDTSCSCGHDHSHAHDDHDHHEHSHSHGGYLTTPVLLRSSTTINQVRNVCERLKPRRLKGVVEGRWIDWVGDTFTISEPRSEDPYVVFIDSEPLPQGIVDELSEHIEQTTKKLKQRVIDAGLTTDEIHYHITRLLALGAQESLDLADQLGRLPQAAPVDRARAFEARLRRSLAIVETGLLAPDDMVEHGAILAYQSSMRRQEISYDLLETIKSHRPATLWLTGIERLVAERLPRYDLMPETYGGPLSPSAAIVIAKWGIQHEGLTADSIIRTFAHMVEASIPYPTWSEGWRQAARQFHANV